MGHTFLVSNAAELSAAISSATGGDRIELASGNYGELLLSSVRFGGEGVTIASADPDNMAVFDKIGLYRSDNLHFDGVEVDYEPTGNTGYNAAFYAFESDDISIRNSILEGGYNEGHSDPEAAIRPSGVGIKLRDNENITIENNDISVFHVGINFAQIDGFVVNDNEIYDLRTSPLTGGDASNVEVIGNHFSTSNPLNLGGTGDHGDLIHFYPMSSQDGPMENIVIRDNFLEQGAGSQSLLGIYIDDAGGGVSGLGYTNVVIENNVIHNGDGQGIRIENVDGLSIQNNSLIQSSGHAGNAPGIVLTSGTENAVVDNNIIAGQISGSSVNGATVAIGDNFFIQNTDPHGANYVGDLFVNGLTSDGEVWDFTPLEGSAAEGYGSTLTGFDVGAGVHVAVISDVRGEGLDMKSIHFDVQSLYDANGEIDFSNADLTWDFGDGTIGAGDEIDHTYASAGSYEVTATFTFDDGETISVDKTVDVFTPDAVTIDFESGFRDTSDIRNNVTTIGEVRLEEGLFGDAVRLVTGGSKVSIRPNEEILDNPDFTISFAFQKDGGTETNSDNGMFVYYSGTSYISTGEGTLAFTGQTSTGQIIRMNADVAQIEDGEWHHVTYTFSSADRAAVLYLDGEEVDRVDGVSGIQHTTSGHNLLLGGRVGGAFGGLMDEVEFTRASLTPDEVQERYETLFGIEGPATVEEDSTAVVDPDPVDEPENEAEPDPVQQSDPRPNSEDGLGSVVPGDRCGVDDAMGKTDPAATPGYAADQSESAAEPVAEAAPESETAPEPQPQAAGDLGDGPAPEQAILLNPNSAPFSAFVPAPQPDPVVEAEAAPEPEPQPDPVTEAEAEPEPQPTVVLNPNGVPVTGLVPASATDPAPEPQPDQTVESAPAAAPELVEAVEAAPAPEPQPMLNPNGIPYPTSYAARETEAEVDEDESWLESMAKSVLKVVARTFGLDKDEDQPSDASDVPQAQAEAEPAQGGTDLFDILTSTGLLDEQMPVDEDLDEDPYMEADSFAF